jgi:aryl-alcohol dehydrogenase-like predicted oxidoreductase
MTERDRPLAIGCMRLSTEPDRDDARAIDVLGTALDLGVTFFDTADAYCLDESEVGHNERLIARALAAWHGDRSRIVVATKGGMTRPNGRWVPDGRARQRSASAASTGINYTRRIHAFRSPRASERWRR